MHTWNSEQLQIIQDHTRIYDAFRKNYRHDPSDTYTIVRGDRTQQVIKTAQARIQRIPLRKYKITNRKMKITHKSISGSIKRIVGQKVFKR